MTKMLHTAEILPFPPSVGGTSAMTNASQKTCDDGSRVMPGASATPAALLAAVTDFIDFSGGGEGHFRTPMGGVRILRAFQEMLPMRAVYQPSVCVVIQGAKEILAGDMVLRYAEMECLVVSIALPASGRLIGATLTSPFLGINIDLDIAMLQDVMQQLPTPPRPDTATGPGAFVGKVDATLSDCIVRLARMARTPDAVPVLYPSAMRELCYWLLMGPFGSEIAKLAQPETHTERIARAIHLLRTDYSQTLRIEQLAEAARMSASSFHQHFKALTSMTPVQYQKQLRLLEARRLLVAEAANVAEAAYRVGYESASQFSREYSRAFGVAPKRDAMKVKALLTYGAY